MENIFNKIDVANNPQEKELIEQLKHNELVLELLNKNKLVLTLVEKYPYEFNEWVSTQEKCANCPGINNCFFHKGYCYDLDLTSGFPMKVYGKCATLKEYEKDFQHRKNYLICDLSEKQLMYSFETTDLSNEDSEYVKKYNLLKDYTKKAIIKGLYIVGTLGTGKTYLACCLCNEYAKRNKKVAFVHMPTFTSNIKFNVLDTDYVEKQMNLMKKAEILVLDDIGAENTTVYLRDEFLLPLLDYRMENELLTFFTSNCSYDELHKRLMLIGNVSDDVKASRIMERIKVLSTPLKVEGKSRRF